LSDGLLINQTWTSLQEVFKAKVIGSWNVHELTLKDPLDHFVLCSAMASLLAPVGLSNYTAANAFLDGLSHYRRTIALPGLSINWGEWSGIGMAKITAAQRGGLAKGLSIKQALTCLEVSLHDADAVQVGIADMDWTVPGQGYDLPFLANTQITVKSEDVKPEHSCELLAEFEDADTRHELLVLLQQYIEKQVRSVLKWPEQKDLDPDHDFFELGMDSLMAVELAYRFQSAFAGRVKVAAPTFYRHPQINSLSRYLAHYLQKPDENGLATHSADLPERLQEAILQSSEV
jgi:aryl carrier-like protein